MIESRIQPKSVGRIVTEPFVLSLAVVDALVVVAFIGVGLFMHTIEPWAFPAYTVRTATPFVIGWAIAASLLGAYRTRVLESVGRTLGTVAVAWIAATLIGGAIRSSSLFPGGAPPEFLLVNAGLGLGFILPWRLAVTAGHRLRAGRR
ncbi:DUF3054 domain-containing protein [Natrinema gari]|uniref:DUF3054 domain-containing protein n=1 Tax=Natrinema gari JCM 14663 TaxID=1230459 RepID=L9YU25_9EURY|nr:DUF3054 domain-containing protein [Natrinema gari]ELY76408.1 hypothetical protein C486_18274 [Natrinema gari JCM 14663]